MRGIATLSLSLLAALASATPILRSRTLPLNSLCFLGTDFPDKSEWKDPMELWNHNKPRLEENNSLDEIHEIFLAIKDNADKSGLDPRVIFAVVMRESGGNAYIHGGDGGRSRGLMQIHTGTSCYGKAAGECPVRDIHGMIHEGVWGTPGFSEGLKSCYDRYEKDYAKALRCYNSGSVKNLEDLSIGLGTPSYVSDVGNILRGQEPATDCGFPEPK